MTSKKPRDDSATDSQDDSDLDGRSPNSKLGRNSGPFLKKIKIKGYDTTDALPKKLNFTFLDIVGIVISLASYVLDVCFDVLVALMHYVNGNTWWFTLTVIFIAIPSLTTTGFSLRWYLVDADTKDLPRVSMTRWILRIVFLLLQMGPLLRYFDSLYYGLKSNQSKSIVDKQEKYYKLMIYEDADATLLRLFECFMESAPQLVLQLYIFSITHGETPDSYSWTELIQLFSMFSSLMSMAWALGSYQRALRYSLQEKQNLNICAMMVQVVWRFLDIAARVIALGLFASVFPSYFFMVCAAHYIIMFIWIRSMGTEFCENQCGEFFYNLVLGVMFIFCYFNPKDSPTRKRFTFYYFLTFLENSAFMCIWFIHSSPNIPYKIPAMFLQFLSFMLGIIIMIIYYLLLHPTKNITVWDHWKKSKNHQVQVQMGDMKGISQQSQRL
ncbi:XK-related protein 4 [Parasteatoda tepidariorum]|uniref:XK-related protein 4 n=1 Tax=Parasteatoda tepidariorum TaxID=114398 RepID=UPI001C72542D|nr:XK-related protein 4 [Parasteatoda tepidariorum]